MSTCPIIAIDPGNAQSGYCVIDRNTLRPLEFGKVDNAELLRKLASATEQGWRWADCCPQDHKTASGICRFSQPMCGICAAR